MTKFILVGGYDWKAADGGKAMCEEAINGFNEPVKLLVCLFARPKEGWIQRFSETSELFRRNLPNRQLDIQMAKVEDFVEQVGWANCIYIRGGETSVLLDSLQQAHGWASRIDGKTIVGSSAGAHILARYSYSPSKLVVQEGLGLLNVKVVTHFQSDFNAPNVDWDKAYAELDRFGEKLPLITLHEGEFKIIVQNMPNNSVH